MNQITAELSKGAAEWLADLGANHDFYVSLAARPARRAGSYSSSVYWSVPLSFWR